MLRENRGNVWWSRRGALGRSAGQGGFSKEALQTSPVVQWLRLHLPARGLGIPALAKELRSYETCGQTAKT